MNKINPISRITANPYATAALNATAAKTKATKKKATEKSVTNTKTNKSEKLVSLSTEPIDYTMGEDPETMQEEWNKTAFL